MHGTSTFGDSSDVASEVSAYLSRVLSALQTEPEPARDPAPDEEALANDIFSLLTSRPFCYLSRKRVECYREQVVSSLLRRIRTGEPFRFFYDIGPGYHATTRPGRDPLRFDVGLSELLILGQVHALNLRVSELYAPGIRFWFVVDNLCALRTNDIPVDCTAAYVKKMRQLIETTGMDVTVALIVESEVFDIEEYDRLLASVPSKDAVADASPAAIDNVSRFLGRLCTPEEAGRRMERYGRTSAVTDQLVNRLVRDVHMTQRATGATLGFRPFAGGDQRTQAGELVLTRGNKGRLKPVLLTTRNVDSYQCIALQLPEVLPDPIPYVVFAEPAVPELNAGSRM